VIINAEGFAPFTSAAFVVTEEQSYEIPDVLLSAAPASIELTVRPTDLITAEQIKSEEKQRLIGVIPNFYTSYIFDTARRSLGNRNSRSLHEAHSIRFP
jgi:hypothetical protein